MRKIILPIVMLCGVANADTCVKISYNITYTCNGGTQVGELPAPETATYGKTFTPKTIDSTMCTPPEGHVQSGYAIIVDGQPVAAVLQSNSTHYNFGFRYSQDIEFGPNWISVINPNVLIANPSGEVRQMTSDGPAWQIRYPYGIIKGLSKCSYIRPEHLTKYGDGGFVSSRQEEIETSTQGNYCYCKMTEPYFENSPWVLAYDNGSQICTSCAGTCNSRMQTNSSFRQALFSAATKQLLEQAGAE